MNSTYMIIECSVIVAICLALGIYALRVDSKNPLHRFFFLICVWFIALNILGTAAYASDTKEGIVFWLKASSLFSHLFFPLNLHFFIYLKEKKRPDAGTIILIYLPAVLLVPVPIIDHRSYCDFIQINGQWKWIPSVHSVWLYILIAFWISYTAVSMYITYRHGKDSRFNREKKQAAVIIITYTLFIAVNAASLSIIPAIYPQAPKLSPGDSIIYILGLFYAIVRFKFLAVTPSLAVEDIISHISNGVILLDMERQILMVNRRAGELLSRQPEALRGGHFLDIVHPAETIEKQLTDFLDGDERSFHIRISYNTKGPDAVLTDSYLSKVKDKFTDTVGILVISREIKGKKEFLNAYKITDREFEIMDLIFSGHSNKAISGKLLISERTVETHCLHIYNKLGIGNKIELVNFAAKFNLLS